MVWRSTGLGSNFFLFLCAYGNNTLNFTLKSETWQHIAYFPFSTPGNLLLIYKPLFTLHFMRIFKLCIKFHVLQILFVSNKSLLSICRVHSHPLNWISLYKAIPNSTSKTACNSWIIHGRNYSVLREMRGGSDRCAILSLNRKNWSKPLSQLCEVLWLRLKALSHNTSH